MRWQHTQNKYRKHRVHCHTYSCSLNCPYSCTYSHPYSCSYRRSLSCPYSYSYSRTLSCPYSRSLSCSYDRSVDDLRQPPAVRRGLVREAQEHRPRELRSLSRRQVQRRAHDEEQTLQEVPSQHLCGQHGGQPL